MQQRYKNLPLVEAHYTFRGHRQVTAFLKEHSYLVPLLLEAYPHIVQHFGIGTQVVLEVVPDPEEDFAQLVAWIQTNLEPEEALARLDALDWDWWLTASDYSQGKLCIHLEYV